MKTHGPRHGSSGTTNVLPDRTTAGGELLHFVRLRDVVPGEHRAPTAVTRAAAPAHPGARARHWGVEQRAAAYPFHVDGDDPMAAASAGGEGRRAAVAVASGLSLALLSYVQFRSARADASALVTAVAEATTASIDRHGADPVTEMPQAVADRIAPPEGFGRRLVARLSSIETADADAPVATTLARLATDVIAEVRVPEPAASSSVPLPAPSPVSLESADTRPSPAPAVVDERPAAPLAVVAAHVDPIAADEDRIRAALTQWRTAYSALDARAAREVWPTVDARALERAFHDLKSQDLRFDRCDLTIDGGSAQAACRGRAIYVPRVGNQSPKASPREWTFQLKKLDERWTIASARAS